MGILKIKQTALRLSESTLSMWALLTLVFFLTRLLGDPAVLLLPVGASKSEIALFRSQLGLDLPLWQQYLQYLGSVIHGHFGQSFLFSRPALSVILERLPATLLLAGTALLLGIAAGMVMGSIVAVRKSGLLRHVITSFLVLGQATPAFWLGMVLILLFAVEWHWLPTGGYGGWKHLVLPALSIAFFLSAHIARITESSIEQVLGENYVRTARSKGLSRATIFAWYVLRNALVPVVTLAGILAGEMIGGSVVIETIFAWPGVGRLIYQAIENQDFPVVSAGIIVISFGVILMNLLIDILYLWIDPRTRAEV